MNAQVRVHRVGALKPLAAAMTCSALVGIMLAANTAHIAPGPAPASSVAPAAVPTQGAVVLAATPDRYICAGATQGIPLPPRGATPAFTGLSLFQDEMTGFAFWYADGWERCETGQQRQGVVLAPQPGESDTWFSVEPRLTGVRFVREDTVGLDAAFHSIIGALPGFELEWHDAWVAGALIGVEARFTFQDGEAVRKRWVRLLFDEGRQIAVIAQGASVEDYAYWEPMIFEMMTTLVLSNAYSEAPENEDMDL